MARLILHITTGQEWWFTSLGTSRSSRLVRSKNFKKSMSFMLMWKFVMQILTSLIFSDDESQGILQSHCD